MGKLSCLNCPYSQDKYDEYSEICDNCMHDPDTGWGGFTDHCAGHHFYSEEDQKHFYETYDNDEYDLDY